MRVLSGSGVQLEEEGHWEGMFLKGILGPFLFFLFFLIPMR
jgi:hypothetical protein